jgi:hypothetical protein
MALPWEQPTPQEPEPPQKPLPTLLDYVAFLDTHVRVRVSIGGGVIGFFAVVDNGKNMEMTERLPDGRILVTEQMPGVPRSYDPIMTVPQLVAYVVTQVKAGNL